jgi:hypothetical protein
MDLAVMISIREFHRTSNSKTHPLHSQPTLSREAFEPDEPPTQTTLGPVVVEGINWIHIKSVTIFASLRDENGEFDFEQKTPSSARGVRFRSF